VFAALDKTMNYENAKSLITVTQQLRTHWSQVITTHLALAATGFLAVWTVFIKSYIDALTNKVSDGTIYLVASLIVTSLLLSFWRSYTKYLDNHIACLYTDFLQYEQALGASWDYGTGGYLAREVPFVKLILADNDITREKKIGAIASLCMNKKIGHRGHKNLECFSALYIVGSCGISWMLIRDINASYYFLLLGYLPALALMLSAYRGQQDPSEKDVREVLENTNV
jgi:hypothetical protein